MEEILKMVDGLPVWVQFLMLGVFACKIITMVTPTKVDDIWFGKLTPFVNTILKALNIGGLNIFFDKNADDKGKK
jgi:hypothetical protein